MKRKQIVTGITAAAAMAVLILDSRTALAGGQEGIGLCIRSLIPSLFPFFVLSGLITHAFTGTSLPILRPVGRIFRIPAGCESLLIPAFLGGYPAGAQCVGQAYHQGNISRSCAQRLLLFCNNAGPAFLFGVLGPVFPSVGTLWALWGIQIGASLLCAWLIPGSEESGRMIPGGDFSLTDSLSASVRIMGNVCGWVILFRVLIAFLERWLLWLLPEEAQVAVSGILELSNGCCGLIGIPDLRMRFLICSGMLSFGGLCVAMQTASVSGGLSLLPYLGSKVVQSVFCLCVSAAFLYRIPMLFVFLAVFYLILKKVVTSRVFMVYNDSINQRRNPYAVSKKNRPRLHVLSAQHQAGGGSDPLRQKGTA